MTKPIKRFTQASIDASMRINALMVGKDRKGWKGYERIGKDGKDVKGWKG